MGKNSYLTSDFENSPEVPSVKDRKSGYDPGRWEDFRIEFTVPPMGEPGVEKRSRYREAEKTGPETNRRRDSERRAGAARRLGSRDRRGWQEPRWIGAADCREGPADRRRNSDRRTDTDRRKNRGKQV